VPHKPRSQRAPLSQSRLQLFPLTPFSNPSAPAVRSRSSRRQSPVVVQARYEKRNDDEKNVDKEDNLVISLVDTLIETTSKNTPGLATLPLGYPLALLILAALLPLSTSLLLVVFFVGFAYIGRRFVQDDDDGIDTLSSEEEDEEEEEDLAARPTTDLLALGAAIVSAGILSPGDGALNVERFPPLGVLLVASLLIGSTVYFLRIPTSSASSSRPTVDSSEREPDIILPEKQWMNRWDQELKDSKKEEDTR
jgi:hypothetical protein